MLRVQEVCKNQGITMQEVAKKWVFHIKHYMRLFPEIQRLENCKK